MRLRLYWHSSTLPSPQCSPTPELAAGDRAEGHAVGLPLRPGEDGGLRSSERDPDSNSMIKENLTQKNKKNYCLTDGV